MQTHTLILLAIDREQILKLVNQEQPSACGYRGFVPRFYRKKFKRKWGESDGDDCKFSTKRKMSTIEPERWKISHRLMCQHRSEQQQQPKEFSPLFEL